MQLACPGCGTRDVRVSTHKNIGEALKSVVGIYQLRCRHCHTRWETSMWEDQAWKYAHCPRCYRQELSTWSMQYYHPPTSVYLKIQLGATPYRCAACRCNFASFRPCRAKFTWRHRTRPTAPEVPAPAMQSQPTEGLPALADALGGSVQPATVEQPVRSNS